VVSAIPPSTTAPTMMIAPATEIVLPVLLFDDSFVPSVDSSVEFCVDRSLERSDDPPSSEEFSEDFDESPESFDESFESLVESPEFFDESPEPSEELPESEELFEELPESDEFPDESPELEFDPSEATPIATASTIRNPACSIDADSKGCGKNRPNSCRRSRPYSRMMATVIWRAFMSALLAALLAIAAPAAASDADVEKPIKTFIGAVRYGKDEVAKKLIDGEAQGRVLLADHWDSGTAEQRKEVVALFANVFSAIAFPKLRENFQKIETIVYGKPAVDKDRAELDSTLVVLHPMKKQEIKVRYTLSKTKSGYKLVDVTFAGDKSVLANIRDDQIQPLFAEGGWPKVLEALREKSKELKK
jgi:phospholipid transport system substrate-binding protein